MSREVDDAVRRMNRSAYAGDLSVTLRRLIPPDPEFRSKTFDMVGVYSNSKLWFVVRSDPPPSGEERTFRVIKNDGHGFWVYFDREDRVIAELDSLEAAVFAGVIHLERPN